jgi:hypothetical protein
MAIQFRDGNGLEHIEFSSGAILEKLDCLLAIQSVKQFPSGVSQPKERLAILSNQEAFVFRHLQARQGRRGDEARAQRPCE